MSRPTKLSSEYIEQICLYIENGNTNKDAVLLAGISESAFYHWTQVGRDLENKGTLGYKRNAIYKELMESLKRAEAKFRAYHLSQINAASMKLWQASAWMLERRYPQEFGKRALEISVPEDEVIPIQIYIPDNGRN